MAYYPVTSVEIARFYLDLQDGITQPQGHWTYNLSLGGRGKDNRTFLADRAELALCCRTVRPLARYEHYKSLRHVFTRFNVPGDVQIEVRLEIEKQRLVRRMAKRLRGEEVETFDSVPEPVDFASMAAHLRSPVPYTIYPPLGHRKP